MKHEMNGRLARAELVEAPVPQTDQMLLINTPRAVIDLAALQTIKCFVDLMPLEINGFGLVAVEGNVETFEKRLRAKLDIKSQLPSFIVSEFNGTPVPYFENNDRCRKFAFSVDSVPFEEQTALNTKGDFIIGKK